MVTVDRARDLGQGVIAHPFFLTPRHRAALIKLNPVVFGSGIPLFAPIVTQVLTELTDHKRYPSGHIVLHYNLKR
jgi:hypothetical protein